MKKMLIILVSSSLFCTQLLAVLERTLADDKLISLETFKGTFKKELNKYYERKMDTKIDLSPAAKQKALMQIQQSINNEKQSLIFICKELQEMAKDLNKKALGITRPALDTGANAFHNECNKMIDLYSDSLVKIGDRESFREPLEKLIARINEAKKPLAAEKPSTEKRQIALHLITKALDNLKGDAENELRSL